MIFKKIFSCNPMNSAIAHARVNLIGEHTDYTGGYVMPSLLPYSTKITIAENKEDNNHCAYSDFFNEKISFNNLTKSTSNDWLDFIKGCLLIFFKEKSNIRKTYFNFLIESNIPIGRGISSSSALCVATLKALNEYFETNYDKKYIAILAQKVERDYIGVSGGIMDQMVSSIGIQGKAFFLNCLSLKYELFDIPKDWIFYLVDSKVQRNLRESAYNERFDQLQKSEKILGVKNLGTVKLSFLKKDNFKDSTIYKRALHVVTENQRVLDAKKYLINNNIKKFGELMNLSHTSYSNDFEASTEDVDQIVNHSLKSGASGCRLTGGGFGGFTVSLIQKKDYDHWYNNMRKFYSEEKFFKV